MSTAVELWTWRRTVSDMYAMVRAADDPTVAWAHWRAVRDGLFRDHPQTPLDAEVRAGFGGVAYFPYDPVLRFWVGLTPILDAAIEDFPAGEDGTVQMRPFAHTVGLAEPLGRELTLYWITGYGGGVFLPFADATSGHETFGAGRYLLDTIKGADLGQDAEGHVLLDFNFAYYPSCAYSPRWVCPLAPAANRLPVAIRGGERDA